MTRSREVEEPVWVVAAGLASGRGVDGDDGVGSERLDAYLSEPRFGSVVLKRDVPFF